MMKRTNVPSHKMQLQAIIKNALASNPTLSCSEFVQILQNKGINILFNLASTGYVSGISYSYEGMTFTGSKLGNDFKWTTIKNNIDYEQERDRTTIHETNARTKSLNPKAQTVAVHIRGDTKALSHGAGEPQTASDQYKNTQRYHSKHTKSSQRSKHVGQFSGEEANGNNARPSKNAEEFSLAALLDGYSHGALIYADHQSYLDPASTLGLKRKGRTRKRSIRR